MKTAAIGIGSNSLRMLLADVSGNELKRLKRYREGMRTFAALDPDGNISKEMIKTAQEKVYQFFSEAKAQGAETVHLFATSAIRDANNQEEFAKALEDITGLKIDVVSGEEEAAFSFVGAAKSGRCGMIDIGGGSTELAFGADFSLKRTISLQMGAVRLQKKYPISDEGSFRYVVEKAKEILAPVCEDFLQDAAEKWVGVGGTFTTLSTLSQGIPHDDRSKVHDYVLTKAEVERLGLFLSPLPLQERLKLHSLQQQRADIAAHGIAILLACMEMLKIDQISVSVFGNLEGYIKRQYIL